MDDGFDSTVRRLSQKENLPPEDAAAFLRAAGFRPLGEVPVALQARLVSSARTASAPKDTPGGN